LGLQQQQNQNIGTGLNLQGTQLGLEGTELGIQGQLQGLQQNLLNQEGSSVYSPIDYSGVQQVQGGNYYDKNAQDAVWNQFQTMQEPLLNQQTEQQQSQLEAQGLRPGDSAYDTAMKNLSNTQYQQQQSAMNQAVLAGEQAAQSNQALDVNAANSQEQLINDKSLNNANLFNQLMGSQVGSTSLPGISTSGAQLPTQLSTQASGTAQTPNLLNAGESQYQAALDAYNAQQGQAASTNAGLEGLGSAALMALAFM